MLWFPFQNVLGFRAHRHACPRTSPSPDGTAQKAGKRSKATTRWKSTGEGMIISGIVARQVNDGYAYRSSRGGNLSCLAVRPECSASTLIAYARCRAPIFIEHGGSYLAKAISNRESKVTSASGATRIVSTILQTAWLVALCYSDGVIAVLNNAPQKSMNRG
jgi:hypothetical protein